MKLKKLAIGVLVLVLSLTFFVPPAMAQSAGKTETVYGALNHDGSVKDIYVVNWLFGSYTDYGRYTQIKNLSTLSQPAIEGDKISFPDEDVAGGLYYQGTMTGELPMTFALRYYLDDRLEQAENLAGTSGHLKIEMDYGVNEKCPEKVRDGLLAQVSAAFDAKTASNVRSNEATMVTVGSAINLSSIIPAGESGTLVMEADVTNFEMNPVTITLLKGTLSISGVEETIDEFEGGIDDMIEGADELVDGTSELKDGMKSMLRGVGALNEGLASLGASGQLIDDGMTQYGTGLEAYISGVSELKPASAKIRAGLDTLAQNGTQVAGGVAQADKGLGGLLASSAELKTLAESLIASPDPYAKMLAENTLAFIGAVEQVSGGLSQASAGVDSYVSGVQEAAKGYAAFDEGIAQLTEGGETLKTGFADVQSGFAAYEDGVGQSAKGLAKLYASIKGLPSDIQKLIDGQIEFKDGITDAKDELTEVTDDLTGEQKPAVSFASPEKNSPSSVQYILTTPGISIKKAPKAEEEPKNQDFFSRLVDLFR